LIDDVLAGLKDGLHGLTVLIDLEDDSLTLRCDRALILLLLSQYLENALMHSFHGGAIGVRAFRSDSSVVFSVTSAGRAGKYL
jgi:K+-sensing histidine kinase KdpD